MKVKIRVIVLVFVVHLYGAQSNLQESLGVPEEYCQDDSSRLDQMWRAIDFELIPQSKN